MVSSLFTYEHFLCMWNNLGQYTYLVYKERYVYFIVIFNVHATLLISMKHSLKLSLHKYLSYAKQKAKQWVKQIYQYGVHIFDLYNLRKTMCIKKIRVNCF